MMLVLLAAVWWQTDQLSEARTRNKLLTETATGYDQVIQEVKATAIQTHKLLAEVKVREQERNAEGERRREAMQAAFNGDACALLCLTLSAAACKNAPPAPIIQLVREPVPESLTEETTRPALDEPVTWGAVAIFSDRLIDALDSCNADKAAIRQWDSLRQNTRKEP
ncbi:hypothetical protein ACLFME_000096 [Klebsiella quasipneumoniae]